MFLLPNIAVPIKNTACHSLSVLFVHLYRFLSQCIKACPLIKGNYAEILLGHIEFMRKQLLRPKITLIKSFDTQVWFALYTVCITIVTHATKKYSDRVRYSRINESKKLILNSIRSQLLPFSL